jgi:hypothetical protein
VEKVQAKAKHLEEKSPKRRSAKYRPRRRQKSFFYVVLCFFLLLIQGYEKTEMDTSWYQITHPSSLSFHFIFPL